MSDKVVDLLKKKLKKYDINLEEHEIIALEVCGVIDLIIRQDVEN